MIFGCKAIAGVLVPLDDIQAEEMRENLTNNKEYAVIIDDKRNAGNHARFFKFIAVAFDMQTHFENRELLRKYLQMKAGHYEEMITPKGDTLFIPKSIAWDKLPESKFRKLFSECITAYLKFYNQHQGRLTEEEFNAILEFD